MTDFYYLAQQRLGPGSIILPGNWGRVLTAWGWGHPHAMREAAMEMYRQAHAPDLPSRMKCIFAFLTIEEARQFQQVPNGGFTFHALHRVRLGEEGADCFVTNHLLVNPTSPTVEWPAPYWRGVPAGPEPGIDNTMAVGTVLSREVLTMTHLIVEECLD